PNLGEQWAALSRLAATLGEVGLALAASAEHVRLQPQEPVRRMNHAALLARFGRAEQALAEVRELARRHPRDARVAHLQGTLLAEAGERDAAVAELRRALSLHTHPEMTAWTWLTLVNLKVFEGGDPDLAALEQLCARPLPPEPMSAACYALGKALDDLGDVRSEEHTSELQSRENLVC